MPRPEDRLTDSERERLDLLVEESGEVLKIAGKIGRHGALSFSPFDEDRTTNRQLLEQELGNLMYAVALMTAAGDVDAANVQLWMEHKAKAVRAWVHHQDGELLQSLIKAVEPQPVDDTQLGDVP